VTTPTTVKVQLKLRQDTSSGWSAVNPILLAGELGRESNTGKIKIGDGSTAWNSLAYQPFGALITNADISATAEIAVSKLADGAARQLLQTDTAGTGVEWTSNVDVPGTLDVTSTATFDSIAQHPLGTAGAPTITFTGDTNTGLYSPGADQVAISTNGTGRLFVDSSGNVGVGAASTGAYFRVLGLTGASIIEATGADTDGFADVEIKSVGTSGASRLYFSDTAAQSGLIRYSHSTNSMEFSTAGSERMRLDSSGRLGLGTSSPNTTLDVAGASGGIVSLTNTSTGVASADVVMGQVNFYTSDASAGNTGVFAKIDAVSNRIFDGDPASGMHMRFFTGTVGNGANTPVERLRITSGGNVGIGTGASAPGGTLEVKAATSVAPFVASGPSSEYARIDSSGRLLVGTPTAAGNNALQIHQNNTDGGGAISLRLGLDAGSINSAGYILGTLNFGNQQGGIGAQIRADSDAPWSGTGSSDNPSRLVFSTTADGASSPTTAAIFYSNKIAEFYNDIRPSADNLYQVGSSGRRWSVVYAGTGTINTSDENLKQDIEALSEAELAVARQIKALIKKYRFKDAVEKKGADARIHVGVIAQEVEQAFVDAGLDVRRYGLFCEDELEDGTKRLAIRYDELLAFVLAAL
jgi:hypothetical protein